MKPIKKRDVEEALTEKGFVKDNRKKHISLRYYTISRVETPVNTIISRGNKKLDIDINILSVMATQCKLQLKDFRLLIDCTLSRTQYEELSTQKIYPGASIISI